MWWNVDYEAGGRKQAGNSLQLHRGAGCSVPLPFLQMRNVEVHVGTVRMWGAAPGGEAGSVGL